MTTDLPETIARLRESVARIVDPFNWSEHERYLALADKWYAKGRTEPGDALTDGCRKKATEIVAPSLAKADAILALPELATLRADLDRAREGLRDIAFEAERENGGWIHLKRIIGIKARFAVAGEGKDG